MSRTTRLLSRHREARSFLLVGLAVAVVGHLMLSLLIAVGFATALANLAQLAVTLQLNFLGNRRLTWRSRIRGPGAGAGAGFWSRWRRFHLARGAGALVCAGLFPVLAPEVGASAAYWSLLVGGSALNYCSDRYWSFSAPAQHRDARPSRHVFIAGAFLALAAAILFLDAFLVAVSLFMLAVAVTTLAFQLYKWWCPEHNDPDRYGEPDESRLPGVILVPMRHEEAVAGHTLERLANLNHPDYWVVPIVDHPDDPGTAAIARAKEREYPNRVVVCRYPEDTEVHNKPIGLNAGIEQLRELGIRYEWIGVADAEDLFHPDLLRMVDYRFRRAGAGIVQCGVQLVNFSSDPTALPLPAGRLARLRRWWKANSTAWWRAANVLEYYKWFQSRLKLQAAIKVMPLGGNTVFFRREFLEALHRRFGTYWDEDCLTEDCKIGIVASVLGYKVDVVYVETMVTREETPHSLGAFLRQRVRWMQGFVQVFCQGQWRALPGLSQRILAVYVLGFQFFQAFTGLFAPVALVLALTHKSSILIALLATIPLGVNLLGTILDVVMLRQFGRGFGEKVRLRDYAGLALGAYPYQVVLSLAAVWSILRLLRGRNDWVKTHHAGVHLTVADRRSAVEGVPA
jgi:cellulose synthase/poly-beta-1,6-N-acetylglucosamine synthase-like glycosyltransferase